MITTSRDQIRRISTKSAIPDPSLMSGKRALELERLVGLGILCLSWLRDAVFEIFDFPDFGGAVGAAGCEVLDVGGEEDAGYVGVVGFEVGYWDELGFFAELEEVPDVDVALELLAWIEGRRRRRRERGPTEFVAAQSVVPSEATVTLETGTSSSGMSWCEQLFSARSQTRTFPPRSQLMISPWLGWITTSVTGGPCV